MDRMATSYDSTWEEEEDEDNDICSNEDRIIDQARGTCRQPQNGKLKRFTYEYMCSSAAQDMQKYRHGYQRPGTNYQGHPGPMANLCFYRNEIKFEPNGLYIDVLLKTWKEDYDMLERNHNYIQWLFPLRERGLNPYAAPLQEKEIEIMKKDSRVKRRLIEAYKLMLGFYGLHLKSEETGQVCRTKNWKERFENLNNKTHNNLRITRILKCLGELGFQHYQAPLVHFFLKETLCQGELKNTKRSVLDYFMFSVKDKRQRRDLVIFAWNHYTPQVMFVWGPVDLLSNYQQRLKKRKSEGHDVVMKKRQKKDKKESYEDVGEQYERRQEEEWEDDRTTKKRNGQGGMKEHDNKPLINHNEDLKEYKSKDEKTRNGQEGMTEHRNKEISQRKNNEDDKREERGDKKPRNDQGGMKEPREEKMSLRKNNEGQEREYKRQERGHKKGTNGQGGMTEHGEEISQRKNDMGDVKEYNWKDEEEENNQGGKKKHMKVKPPHNNQHQSDNNGDDNKQRRRENGQDNRIKLMEENIQDGQKKDEEVETSGNTRPHAVDNGDGKRNNTMGDGGEENIKPQNSCNVTEEHGKVDIPNDKRVTDKHNDDELDVVSEEETINCASFLCGCFCKGK